MLTEHHWAFIVFRLTVVVLTKLQMAGGGGGGQI